MFKIKDEIPCWEVTGTLCNHPGLETIQKAGKRKCDYCIYFKIASKELQKS
jgi:hypothetical protein